MIISRPLVLVLLCHAAPAQAAWLPYPNPLPAIATRGFAFDPNAGRLLAVGATRDTATGARLLELHESSGSGWQLVSGPTPVPGSYIPNNNLRLAYDAVRDRLVLLYGRGAVVYEWSGSAWVARAPAAGPTFDRDFGFWFDPARQACVAVGLASNQTAVETWEWDGASWTRLALTAELPFDFAEVAYNSATATAMAITLQSGTWELQGAAWRQVGPAFGPGVLDLSIAYEATSQAMVAGLGVSLADPNRYTLRWDGSTWQPLAIATSARAICGAGDFVFGASYTSSQLLRLYVPPSASSTPFASGCPGAFGSATMLFDSAPIIGSTQPQTGPVLGTTFTMSTLGVTPWVLAHSTVVLGFDRNTWGGLPLPLDLSALSLPGCMLHVSVDLLLPQAGYPHAVAVPIPNDLALSGVAFFVQPIVQDFAVSGPVTSLGDAYRCMIGAPR